MHLCSTCTQGYSLLDCPQDYNLLRFTRLSRSDFGAVHCYIPVLQNSKSVTVIVGAIALEVIQRCVLQTTWTPYMLFVNRKLSESGKQLGESW